MAPSSPFEPTGVPHLDLVLGGGLPRGALAIILGPPGSGKTTLASQIAFAAARRGQQALLLTALSEPTTKLIEHLRAYRFFAPELIGSTVQIFSLQQFLSKGAAPTAQDIVAAVRQTKAHVVVLDGFQGIRDLAPDFTTARQVLYDMGMRLSLQGTTTLITTEADPRDPKLFPEMTTGDTLIGLYFSLEGVRSFRGLEVLKVRGRAPLPGRHALMLSGEGLHVFPRLETLLRPTFEPQEIPPPASADNKTHERAPFGLDELDEMLNGGLTLHTNTLLTGGMGTGKTFLGLQFLLTGLSRGESALYLGFRETEQQLVQKADNFALGQQLRQALEPTGGLTLLRREPVELDPDRIATELLETIDRTGTRRLVIDSITELVRAVRESSGDARLVNYLTALQASLRARGVTLLAIRETSKGATVLLDLSADALAVLTDNVILLQRLSYRGQFHRALSILKMRFSAHDHTLREFVITQPEGIRVLRATESDLAQLSDLTLWQGEIIPAERETPSRTRETS